jgi:hypothetical protein
MCDMDMSVCMYVQQVYQWYIQTSSTGIIAEAHVRLFDLMMMMMLHWYDMMTLMDMIGELVDILVSDSIVNAIDSITWYDIIGWWQSCATTFPL